MADVNLNVTVKEWDPWASEFADGNGDITDWLVDRVAHHEMRGGGKISPPPGEYTLSAGFEYDILGGPLKVDLECVQLTCAPGVVPITFYVSGRINAGRCKVLGDGGSITTSPGCPVIHAIDCQGNVYDGVKGEGGDGIWLENSLRWSENTKIYNCGFQGRTAVWFMPAKSGELGTDSFAGTSIRDLWVGGGTPGYPKIWFAGAVYGSVVDKVRGNIPSSPGALAGTTTDRVEVLRVSPGWYPGTVLQGPWDVETVDGQGGGSCMFRNDDYGGSEIKLMASVHPSNNMLRHHPDFPKLKFGATEVPGVLEFEDWRAGTPIAPANDATVKAYAKQGEIQRRNIAGSKVL